MGGLSIGRPNPHILYFIKMVLCHMQLKIPLIRFILLLSSRLDDGLLEFFSGGYGYLGVVSVRASG